MLRIPKYCPIFFLSALLAFGLTMGGRAQESKELRAPMFRLFGQILDEKKQPLAGATIEIHETGQGAFSDSLGRFVVERLKAGAYHVHIQFIGYETFSQTVDLRLGDAQINAVLRETHIELPSVVVESDITKTAAREKSLSMEVVDESFFQKHLNTNLLSSLTRLPGFKTINMGAGIAKPVIRGLSFNRVVVVENGVKQEGQQWGADHGLEIDQFNANRVELIKGPASLIYGTDAMAGVVNIQPAPAPFQNGVKGAILFNYSSNNQNFATSAMLTGNHNGKVFRLRFSSQDYADYRVPATEFTYNRYILPIYNNTLKNTAGRERNFSAMIGLQKKWGHTYLTASYYNQKAGIFAGAMGVPRAYQLTDDGDSRNIDLPYFLTEHLKITSNTQILFNRNWLEIDAGYQRNHRQEWSLPHAHGPAPPIASNLALELILQTFSLNARYHHTLFKKLDGVAGVSGVFQMNKHAGFEFLLSNFFQGNGGVFLYEKYSPNSRTTFNGGLRFDAGGVNIEGYTEAVYNDSLQIEGYRVRNSTIIRAFSSASGSFGVSYFPLEHLNLKANIGSSFRFPTAPELSANGPHHGAFRHEKGDSSLKTERGYQLDLNLTYQKKAWLLKFSPYFSFFQNYIYLDPSYQFSFLPSGGQIYQYSQTSALHYGAEITVELHPVKPLHFAMMGEYVGMFNLAENLPMPFIPPSSLLLEAEYTFEKLGKYFKNIFIKPDFNLVAPQNQTARNEKATPGYFTVNLTSGFDLVVGKQSFKFYFQILNLTDAHYMRHLSRYRLLNLPEAGRNFMFTLSVPIDRWAK